MMIGKAKTYQYDAAEEEEEEERGSAKVRAKERPRATAKRSRTARMRASCGLAGGHRRRATTVVTTTAPGGGGGGFIVGAGTKWHCTRDHPCPPCRPAPRQRRREKGRAALTRNSASARRYTAHNLPNHMQHSGERRDSRKMSETVKRCERKSENVVGAEEGRRAVRLRLAALHGACTSLSLSLRAQAQAHNSTPCPA